MDLKQYQVETKRTFAGQEKDSFSPIEVRLMGNALGIATESGELVDVIKKGVWHRHGVDLDKFIDELGDLCPGESDGRFRLEERIWYISSACIDFELDLEEVIQEAMEYNIEKLKKRFLNGFTYEDSRRRDA